MCPYNYHHVGFNETFPFTDHHSVTSFACAITNAVRADAEQLEYFFHQLPEETLSCLASQLQSKKLLTSKCNNVTFRVVIMEFLAGLHVCADVPRAIMHCAAFIEVFNDISGACFHAANLMKNSWEKAVGKEFV